MTRTMVYMYAYVHAITITHIATCMYNHPNSFIYNTLYGDSLTPLAVPLIASGPPTFSQQPTRQEGFFRIVLSWNPPANPNGVIIGYIVRHTHAHTIKSPLTTFMHVCTSFPLQVFVDQSRTGSDVFTLMSPVTTWTSINFLPNTEHTFEVAAINGAPINNGQGEYSTVVTAKTGFGGTLLKCFVIIHL